MVKAVSCNTEHLTCALAVGACDNGSVYVGIIAALEVVVNSTCHYGANSEHSVKCVCTGSEVRNCSEEFKSVALLLQGIVQRTLAKNFNGFCVNLNAALSCLNNLANNLKCCAKSECSCGIFNVSSVKNYLKMLKRCAVVKLCKSHSLGLSGCTHPTAHCNLCAKVCGIFKQTSDVNVFHK